MHTPTCPFCHAALDRTTSACPSCRQELPAAPPAGKCRSGWLVGLALAAVMAATTAVLVRGFLNERRYWLE
ncbi:MAG: hypothetical protein ACOY8P_01630 [Thermodesulfobacteriota bacterium]